MKNTKEQTFEKELPEGYRQVLHINAKNASFGIIFNLIAFAVLAIVMVLAVVSLKIGDRLSAFTISHDHLFIGCLGMVVYMVLHELLHGVAYKARTKERLTFGLSWSCAFCGVPNIFTYRKTAMIAVVAPFALFTLIFIPLLVLTYLTDPAYYLVAALLFGLHFGGCSGDLYVLYLLTFRFKDKKALMRDTGPEQFFYLPD